MRRLITAIAVALAAQDAPAHESTLTAGDGIVLPASTLALIACAGFAYAVGLRRVWRAAGRARGIGHGEATRFFAGLGLLALTLSPPVDAAAHRAFAAHMTQHGLLMLAVPPLLAASRSLAAWTWALPKPARVRLGRAFAAPAWRVPWTLLTSLHGATALQLGLLALWHIPAAFDAAAARAGVHALQHACFLGGGLAFWWALLRPGGRDRAWPAALALFVTMVGSGALGALLAVAPQPLYRTYADAPGALEDQQLGGILMWVPGGTVYVLAALAILARWFGRSAASRHRSLGRAR